MIMKNQKGFSPVILIVVISIIVGVVAIGFVLLKSRLGASMLSSLVPTTITGIAPKVSEKDFTDIKDPNIRKHFAAQSNQSSYRMQTNSSNEKGYMVFEVQLNGERYNSRTTQNNGQKDVMDMISLADDDKETIYLKDYSDNKWWKQVKPYGEYEPMTEEDSDPTTKPEDFAEDYTNVEPSIEYTSQGKEKCPNVSQLTCFKYLETVNGRVFWFDDKDYLLRGEQTEIERVTTTNYYTYDVSIKAPTPTKDVAEGKDIYEYFVLPEMQLSPEAERQLLEGIEPENPEFEFPDDDFEGGYIPTDE